MLSKAGAIQLSDKENGVEIIHEFADAGKSGLNAEGRPAFTEMMKEWVTKRDDCAAACRNFGSWRAALESAGLKSVRQRWTKQLVIQAIRARQQAGLPLTSHVFKQDGALVRAADRHFGSWRQALAAARIEPTTLADRKGKTA